MFSGIIILVYSWVSVMWYVQRLVVNFKWKQLSEEVKYSSHIYKLVKFTCFQKAQNSYCGNVCKVDHQELPYVKVLSETLLYLIKNIMTS